MDNKDVFLNKDIDLDTRLKSVIPYFKIMKNTATAQCVYNIFRELYGFNDELNEGNYKELLVISIKCTSKSDQPNSVFKKANINAFATSVGNACNSGNERSDFSLMV